jgi:hypothetical protein
MSWIATPVALFVATMVGVLLALRFPRWRESRWPTVVFLFSLTIWSVLRIWGCS